MKNEIVVALRMTLVTLVLTGLAYPLAVTGLAQVLFPHRANGSLITQEGRVIGSELIGQGFKSPGYFQSRPSAAGADGYDAANSCGLEPGADFAEAARSGGGRRGPAPVREPEGAGRRTHRARRPLRPAVSTPT